MEFILLLMKTNGIVSVYMYAFTAIKEKLPFMFWLLKDHVDDERKKCNGNRCKKQ